MSWWFHLLVRRVENLRARCDVAERVFLAVGPVRYAETVTPILIERKRSVYSRGAVLTLTVNGFEHSVRDAPSFVVASAWRTWRKNDVLHRDSGPALIHVYHMFYSQDAVVVSECWREGKNIRSFSRRIKDYFLR